MYIFQILLFIQATRTVLLQEGVSPMTPHPGYASQLELKRPANYDMPIEQVPMMEDAQDRGGNGYSHETEENVSGEKDDDHSYSSHSTSVSKSSSKELQVSDASSVETNERQLQLRVYRTCTPCPREMMKAFRNNGIRWICAGYQRARRTFKSDCMMRYRNCQDGTLFVKLYDHKCKNDSYHGRHFFYQYRT